MIPTFKRVAYQAGYLISHIDRKNIHVFLVCVVVATCLWVFNSLYEERLEAINYPILFKYDRDKYMVLDTLPKHVPLMLKGSGWQILHKVFHFKIEPITLEISPDLQMKRPYLLRAKFEEEAQKILEHVSLQKVILDTLNCSMDYKYRRVLRLVVDSLKLNLPKDYRLVSPIKIHPELVAVIGPKTQIKALQNPYVLDMSKMEMKERKFNKTFDIYIKELRPDLLIQDEKKVAISFEIERFIQKTITVGINATNPVRHFIPIQVNYSVRESEVDKVQIKDFVLEGDWSEYKKNDGTITVHLKQYPAQINPNDIFFIKRVKVE